MKGSWPEFFKALAGFVVAVLVLIVCALALFQLGGLLQGIGQNQ